MAPAKKTEKTAASCHRISIHGQAKKLVANMMNTINPKTKSAINAIKYKSLNTKYSQLKDQDHMGVINVSIS